MASPVDIAPTEDLLQWMIQAKFRAESIQKIRETGLTCKRELLYLNIADLGHYSFLNFIETKKTRKTLALLD